MFISTIYVQYFMENSIAPEDRNYEAEDLEEET